MADLIEKDTGESSDVTPGNRGELTIWVDGQKVAEKDNSGFPAEDDVVVAVRRALNS